MAIQEGVWLMSEMQNLKDKKILWELSILNNNWVQVQIITSSGDKSAFLTKFVDVKQQWIQSLKLYQTKSIYITDLASVNSEPALTSTSRSHWNKL